MSSHDLSQHSMLDLFRLEAESQIQVLTSGLLALERDHAASSQLEACMRAAHSLKGAARIVDLPVAVRVAHAMEDCFVAAQAGRVVLGREGIDVLLRATDLIGRIAGIGAQVENVAEHEVEACLAALARVLEGGGQEEERRSGVPEDREERRSGVPGDRKAQPSSAPRSEATPAPAVAAPDNPERVLRVTADHLNRLLGLTAESLVGARWVKSFSESLGRLKRMHNECADLLDGLHQAIPPGARDAHSDAAFSRVRGAVLECHHF